MLCDSHAMKYYIAIKKNEISQIDQYKKYGTILSGKSKLQVHRTMCIFNPMYFKNMYVFVCISMPIA